MGKTPEGCLNIRASPYQADQLKELMMGERCCHLLLQLLPQLVSPETQIIDH